VPGRHDGLVVSWYLCGSVLVCDDVTSAGTPAAPMSGVVLILDANTTASLGLVLF